MLITKSTIQYNPANLTLDLR